MPCPAVDFVIDCRLPYHRRPPILLFQLQSSLISLISCTVLETWKCRIDLSFGYDETTRAQTKINKISVEIAMTQVETKEKKVRSERPIFFKIKSRRLNPIVKAWYISSCRLFSKEILRHSTLDAYAHIFWFYIGWLLRIFFQWWFRRQRNEFLLMNQSIVKIFGWRVSGFAADIISSRFFPFWWLFHDVRFIYCNNTLHPSYLW